MVAWDPDDLDKDIDQNTRDIMLNVILQWARYDALVSQWAIQAFGMPLDSGSILLGTMDTRTKLDRLKSLYDHHGMSKSARSVANLLKIHKTHVGVRNCIAHSTCGGRRISDPSRIVFAPVKAFKGTVGHMTVEHIHLDQMRAAAAFAEAIGDRLMVVIDALGERQSEPPPEPPVFRQASRPTPQKKRAGKRQRPHPRKRG